MKTQTNKQMNKFSIQILGAAVLGLALGACGPKNNQVQAGKQFFPEEGVRTFAFAESDEAIEFKDITFFLWKKDMAPEHVQNVLLASKALDKIELDLVVPKKELKAINEQREKMQEELSAKNKEIRTTKAALKAAENSKKEEEAKPEEEQDKDKIAALTKEIEELKAKQVVANQELAKLKEDQAKKSEELDAQTKANETKQNDLESRKTELLGKVLANVEYRVPPTSLGFQKKFAVTQSGERRTAYDVKMLWNPEANEEGDREYSTQNGLTSELKYTEKGGLLEFGIRLSATETYQVKVARTGYDDKLGREIYSGDLTYRSYEDHTLTKLIETRYGVAKFGRLPPPVQATPAEPVN